MKKLTRYYIYSAALALLLALALSACGSSADRRHMEALVAEADSMNRNYVNFTTDSAMLLAADYFDRHGTPNERMKAHYLLGCAYRDMGEAPRALAAFHDAIDCADTTAADFDLNAFKAIYGQMAELYHLQKLPTEELEATRIYGRLALQQKDTFCFIRNMELSAGIYFLQGDTEKVLSIKETARQLYIRHGYRKQAASIYNTPIFISIQRGELEKAKQMMEIYEKHSGLFDSLGNIEKSREWYYYNKGLYYIKTGQLGLAEQYMRRLPTERERERTRGLLLVYRQLGNADSVFKYSLLYEDAIDSLNSRTRIETLSQMTKLYNYQRIQDAANRAELEKERLVAQYIHRRTLLAVHGCGALCLPGLQAA